MTKTFGFSIVRADIELEAICEIDDENYVNPFASNKNGMIILLSPEEMLRAESEYAKIGH